MIINKPKLKEKLRTGKWQVVWRTDGKAGSGHVYTLDKTIIPADITTSNENPRMGAEIRAFDVTLNKWTTGGIPVAAITSIEEVE